MPNRITKGKALLGAVNLPVGGLNIAGTVVNIDAAELNILDGVTKTAAQINKLVGGTVAGVLVNGGITALDGSNPTPIATGFTAVTGFSATLQGTAAPGVGTSALTWGTVAGGTVNVYAWKVTGTGDTTLIASTGTETFSWTATGT